MRLPVAEANTTYEVNALLDQNTIASIRFSVASVLWADREFFTDLPARVLGTFARWIRKDQLMPSINWDDGGRDTNVGLTELLAAGMKLEPYADNRRPPKPKRWDYATQGGAAHAAAPAAAAAERRFVDIKYNEGGRTDLTQKWYYETPEAISVDQRQDERQRPTIKGRDKSDYNTAYGMWANVCLPMNYIKAMFDVTGYLNERLNGRDNSFQNKCAPPP